jgi:hypothetical protein
MFKAAKIGPLKDRTIGKKSESVSYDAKSEAKMRVIIQNRIAPTICEAIGCFAQSTTIIEVKAGHQRTLSLSLCKECVSKFRDEAE